MGKPLGSSDGCGAMLAGVALGSYSNEVARQLVNNSVSRAFVFAVIRGFRLKWAEAYWQRVRSGVEVRMEHVSFLFSQEQ